MRGMLFSLTAISLMTVGCSVAGIQGSGVRSTGLRKVEDFERIELSGVGTVTVSNGVETSVTVTTDDNLMEYIETSVSSGKLRIRPAQPISPKTPLLVEVITPEINEFECSGAGTIELRDIQTSELQIELSGACKISGSGNVDVLRVELSGAGDVSLRELVAKEVEVSISGAANATLYATESLDAEVSGAGKITCYGNPTDVKKNVSGVGAVKIAGD